MGKIFVTEECFPGLRNNVKLTEPIPLEVLSELLYQHYDAIVGVLGELFPPHSAGAKELQPSRGKMGLLRQNLEKTLGISDATTTGPGIETIGDARRFGKRVRTVLAEARDGGTAKKSKMMNVRVHDLCKKAVNETITHLMQIIAGRIPEGAAAEDLKPAKNNRAHAKQSAAAKQRPRQAPEQHQVSGNGRASDPAIEKSTRVSRPYEPAVYEDSPDGDNDIIDGVSWRKALRDPDRMMSIFAAVDRVAPAGEEHKVRQKLPTCVPYQAFRSERNARENYDFASRALHELKTTGKILLQHAQSDNANAWSLVFACIEDEVHAEIASGNTVFDASEFDVAFEIRITEYKLGSRYKKCIKARETTLSARNITKKTEEEDTQKDASTKGFTKAEIARIPCEDRARLNDLFHKLSVEGAALRVFQSFTEPDAAVLCDIARIVLTHQDTLGSQFRERLGMPDGLVWKVIQDHDYSLLTQAEADAMPKLAGELAAIESAKNGDEEPEQMRRDSTPRMVLYRRLLRLEHAHDHEEKLEKILEVLGMEDSALAAKEWKVFLGLSNHHLAPDLFEQEDDGAYEDLAEILEELKLLKERSKKPKSQRRGAKGA